MRYSYTQIAHYLACPRRYKYRYLEGWQEKDTRASMLFGRAFEMAIAALFQEKNYAEVLEKEWVEFKGVPLTYARGDSWDKMLQQGIRLLESFSQHNRIRVKRPDTNLQAKFTKPLSGDNDFVAYIDAIGDVDGRRSIIDWKTTSARYPEEPRGMLSLDPQLISYSWATGIENVAVVVFVRKLTPEIQYLTTTITAEQRREYESLVIATVLDIEEQRFQAHSGIRFPQNPCASCPCLGLCLKRPELIEKMLIHKPGGDLGWLDELAF